MSDQKRQYTVATDHRMYETYDKSITTRLEGRLADLPFSDSIFDINAVSVLKKRYLAKDEDGKPLEDARKLMIRVAANVAYPDFGHTQDENAAFETARAFYDVLLNREFMPNSPTLMNAGRPMQQLSACFVLPIADKMKYDPKKDPIEDFYKGAILNTLKDTGDIHQTGGGTGFSFGNLRRKNDFVSTTYGKASGPVSFIGAFDAMTHSVNQGGFRRGANMGMLPIDHPDILQFMHAKENESSGRYTNFNFSIAIPDYFMRAVENDEHYVLKNPRKGKLSDLTVKDIERDSKSVKEGLIKEVERVLIVDGTTVVYQNPTEFDERGEIRAVEKIPVGKVDEEGRITLHARTVYNELARLAHKNGEPGVVFVDRLNKDNPTHPQYFSGDKSRLPIGVGVIESTNPCGEQPLLGYEACNLGSINLGLMVKNNGVDYERLGKTVDTAVKFLDNVIDMGNFPLEQIVETVHRNRKIGLGVMGWADMLAQLGVPYSSDKALGLAEDVMKFIRDRGIKKSEQIAEERGVFPNFENSRYAHDAPRRNATITTIAPTGTISMIAGASGAIEPFFDLVYYHTDADGQSRKFVNKELMSQLKARGIDVEKVEQDLIAGKKLKDLEGIPEDIKTVFLTANDIPVEYHVRMQAAFQRYTDNAVSKTINLPKGSDIEAVKSALNMSYAYGCKGITVYVDESRKKQVLNRPKENKDLEQITATGVAVLPRGQMNPLPSHLPASYSRQRTPWGHLHLNVSLDPKDNYREVQFFAQLGKSGENVSADLEAISRLASTIMRLGGDINQHVIDQLDGIGAHKMIPTVDGPVVSLPDAVAKALKNYIDLRERVGPEKLLLGQYNLEAITKEKIEAKLNGTKSSTSGQVEKASSQEEDWEIKCPDCGFKAIKEANCFRCPRCGWSKC